MSLSADKIKAQQEVSYSLYRYHLNLVNPAATGTQGAPYLNISVRSQWVGINDAPETQAVSFGTPNKKDRLGTGFSIINDKTFVENQTQLFADFSYRLPLNNERDLFLGLKAGGTSIRLKASELVNYGGAATDPYLIATSSFVPNIGVGFYYRTPTYYFSASIPRLLNTKRHSLDNGQVTHATDRPHLFVSSGIRLALSDTFDLYPSVMVSYVEGAPYDFLGDFSFSFKKQFDVGVQYTRSGALGATTSISLSKGLKFGYSYLTSFQDKVNKFSNGTHEFVLKIKLGAFIETPESSSTTESEEGLINETMIGPENRNKK